MAYPYEQPSQYALNEALRAATRYFRALITLDLVLCAVAVSNAALYMRSTKNTTQGSVWALALILLLVLDLVMAILLWMKIPRRAKPIGDPQDIDESWENLDANSWSFHSRLAKWNLISNVCTTAVYAVAKVMMAAESDLTVKFFATLILFSALRGIKLVPLAKFWRAIVMYDHDVPDRLLQWQPNKYEEHAATVIEWVIIGIVGSLLFIFATLTVYLYANGSTWAEVFHPKPEPLPSWLEPMPSMPSQETVSQVVPPQATTSLATPARRLAQKCVSHCVDGSGLCCCTPTCPNGVAFLGSRSAAKVVKISLETGGSASGAGLAVGGAIGGLAAAGGEAAMAGVAIGGPIGGLVGGVLGGIVGLCGAMGSHEAGNCIKECSQVDKNPPGCYCGR